MRQVPWWLQAALVASGVLAGAVPVRAQQPAPHREGFWIGVGLGYGSASMPCFGRACSASGVTAVLRLGGTVNRHLRVGGEVNAWGRGPGHYLQDPYDPGALLLRGLSAVAIFYPSETGTFFLEGGAGLVTSEGRLETTVDSREAGVSVGVGIDLYLGRRFSLTPTASYVTAVSGRISLFTLGLAATWH